MSNITKTGGSNGIDITNFVNNLGDGEMNKPNCKLCNSKFRKEAESLADKGSGITTILRFLENAGEPISYNAVSNHINYHFKTKQSETDLKEYVGQLEKWSEMSQADDVLINKYIRMLDMEITSIGAKNANVDLTERRKNDEIMSKMIAQVQQLKETSRKLGAEMQPIQILFQSLNKIIETKLMSGITIEAKKALQDVIDQLKKEVGEVPIEGKKQED